MIYDETNMCETAGQVDYIFIGTVDEVLDNEERYLLSEVMEKPEHADDRVYYQLLKLAGKSMLEQVAEVRRERT